MPKASCTMIRMTRSWELNAATEKVMHLAASTQGDSRAVDLGRIEALRAEGVGWKRIAAEMGAGVGTIYRIALGGSKIRQMVF
jgi:hypothetical protein